MSHQAPFVLVAMHLDDPLTKLFAQRTHGEGTNSVLDRDPGPTGTAGTSRLRVDMPTSLQSEAVTLLEARSTVHHRRHELSVRLDRLRVARSNLGPRRVAGTADDSGPMTAPGVGTDEISFAALDAVIAEVARLESELEQLRLTGRAAKR